MSSVSKNSKISLKITPRTRRRSRRRTSTYQRRRTTTTTDAAARASSSKASRTTKNGGRTCSKVSDKLEALKNLIPTNKAEIVKPDQLFQETADYIVRLRTQVFILQRLIQFYGSNSTTATAATTTTATTSNSTKEAADNNNLVL